MDGHMPNQWLIGAWRLNVPRLGNKDKFECAMDESQTSPGVFVQCRHVWEQQPEPQYSAMTR